jgi:F-type H+-transporting ATPase subunit b
MITDFLIPIAHAAETAAPSTSILGSFGVDWVKFIAQFINFGIVLFILWKWVFTPVTAALQKRTEKIEKSLRDAETTVKEKEEFNKWKEMEMTKVRSQATSIVAAAEAQGQKAKDEILKQTQEEQQKAIEHAKKQIEIEKNQAMAAAKSELADLVTNATERVIKQKMDSAKDKEMIKEMLKSL